MRATTIHTILFNFFKIHFNNTVLALGVAICGFMPGCHHRPKEFMQHFLRITRTIESE